MKRADALVAVIVGLVIGVPAMALFVALGLALSALDAYVIWKGLQWHFAQWGVSFTMVWAAKIVFGLWVAPLRPNQKDEKPAWAHLVGRPIAALIALALLAWLR
jgi:hypothetical protein